MSGAYARAGPRAGRRGCGRHGSCRTPCSWWGSPSSTSCAAATAARPSSPAAAPPTSRSRWPGWTGRCSFATSWGDDDARPGAGRLAGPRPGGAGDRPVRGGEHLDGAGDARLRRPRDVRVRPDLAAEPAPGRRRRRWWCTPAPSVRCWSRGPPTWWRCWSGCGRPRRSATTSTRGPRSPAPAPSWSPRSSGWPALSDLVKASDEDLDRAVRRGRPGRRCEAAARARTRRGRRHPGTGGRHLGDRRAGGRRRGGAGRRGRHDRGGRHVLRRPARRAVAARPARRRPAGMRCATRPATWSSTSWPTRPGPRR